MPTLDRRAVAALALACLLACGRSTPGDVDPSVTLLPPQGTPRVVDFTTDEGTWLSLDVSPDGRTIVFDLLGQIYRLPIAGGQAEPLTANSGVALNFHPAYSPDGSRIAFISDRQGQNDVWTMAADGSDPRPVFLDRETRFMAPAWAPDGKSIVAVRVFPTPGRGWHRQMSELWTLPLDGGEPRRLLGQALSHYDAPRFSADGKYLYFQVSYSTGEGLGMLTAGHRLQRLELATGAVTNVRTSGPAELSPAYVEALRRTGWAEDNDIDPPAALAPAVSPDGRYLAFGLERRDTTFSYRGHEYAPSTSLVVRDLQTGEEHIVLWPAAKDLTQVNAQYGYGAFPRVAWTPDSKGVVAWAEGKIHRVDLTGANDRVVPFTARVHRVMSEAVRGRIRIDDSSFATKFIQWPVASPDGKRLAFVAVGKVWLMDLAGGAPRPLTPEMAPAVQLTPAWSPAGDSVAFAVWDDSAKGDVAVAAADGSGARRLGLDPAEYLYPHYSRDGGSIVVSKGPGPSPNGTDWNGWNRAVGWTAVRVPVAGGGGVLTLASLSGAVRTYDGPGGRVYFQYQDHADRAPSLLYYPFPSDSALALTIRVRSVGPEGGAATDHAVFPAARDKGAQPVLSPGGTWVAFQAGQFLYVSPLAGDEQAPVIDTKPDDSVPGRRYVDPRGGVYASWRDSTTLQYAAGSRYLTYDVATGRRTTTDIDLRIPRPRPSGSIALVNAKIVTADSDRVIDRGTVVVQGARIACVGECDTTGVDRVMDLSGKTIIPGLFDLHAHHTAEESGIVTPHRVSSALDLAYGVTTILDPATSSESAFPLAELIASGAMEGPRTFSVAEIVIYPGVAWGDQKILLTEQDADREVDRRADWGAVSIKNYRQPARWQHELLLQAARRRGITVTGEGGPLYFDVGLVMDGQTGWEHLIANLPVYHDVAEFFGQAHAVYSPTAIVAGHVLGSMHYFRPRQHLERDAKYLRFMPRAELAARSASDRMRPKSAFSFPFIAEGMADIVRAGGYGVLGEHGEQPGIGTHWEIWSYAEALKPLEAIRVATIDGAYFIGIDHETGSITRGKLADLVVLNADPLADIHNTADIASVMKAGHLYDDDTLDELWPARRRYGPIPWR